MAVSEPSNLAGPGHACQSTVSWHWKVPQAGHHTGGRQAVRGPRKARDVLPRVALHPRRGRTYEDDIRPNSTVVHRGRDWTTIAKPNIGEPGQAC